MTLLRPPTWTQHATCANHPLGPTPWDNHGTPTARTLSATCPVQYDCARYALDNAIPHGMYGGLTPTDRRHIAAQHGFDPPGAAQHGNRSRYVAGCRCNLCREAHRRWTADRYQGRSHRTPDTTNRKISA